jgi:hypothetical protein
MKFLLPISLLFASVLAAPGATAASCNLNQVLQYMQLPHLANFTKIRSSSNRASCYDWCADGCSGGSSDWWPIRFGAPIQEGDIYIGLSCARHDFAYRNLKMLDGGKGWTKANKAIADNQLKKDIEEQCVGSTHDFCKDVGPIYSFAVKELGGEGGTTYKSDCKCTVFPGCCDDHASQQQTCLKKNQGITGQVDYSTTCSPSCRAKYGGKRA